MRDEFPAARQSVVIASALVKQWTIEFGDVSAGPFLELVDRLARRGVQFHLLFAGNPSAPFLATLRNYPHLLHPEKYVLAAARRDVRHELECSGSELRQIS